MAAAGPTTIFEVIDQTDLTEAGRRAEVQRRVAADPAMVEERHWFRRDTPLAALWLLAHGGGGRLDVSARNCWGEDALYWACTRGSLSAVRALVAAGAVPLRFFGSGWSALQTAAFEGHVDVVAYLLTLPAVRLRIDGVCGSGLTALGCACWGNRPRAARLLLEAGADPTIPAAGAAYNPAVLAARPNNRELVALLQQLTGPMRARRLAKARCILEATYVVRSAQAGGTPSSTSSSSPLGRAGGKGEQQQQQQLSAAAACLWARVERGEAPPAVAFAGHGGEAEEEERAGMGGKRKREQQEGQQQEKRRAIVAYVLGVEAAGCASMPSDLFTELLAFMAKQDFIPMPQDEGEARRRLA